MRNGGAGGGELGMGRRRAGNGEWVGGWVGGGDPPEAEGREGREHREVHHPVVRDPWNRRPAKYDSDNDSDKGSDSGGAGVRIIAPPCAIPGAGGANQSSAHLQSEHKK